MCIWLSPLLLTSLHANAEDEHVFRINTGFVEPVSSVYRLILEEAFKRAGLQLDFQEVTAQRSIALANAGTDDGECCRIWEINQTFPNLLPVPIEIMHIDFVAFTTDADMQVKHWNDLAPYDVGVVHGWKILETGLAEHPPREIVTLNTPESMFGMLDQQRIQVATIDRLVGYKTALSMGLKNVRVLEPPLVSRPLYLQLHKKHSALIPKLTHVMAVMRAEGLMDEYYQQIVQPIEKAFLPSPSESGHKHIKPGADSAIP